MRIVDIKTTTPWVGVLCLAAAACWLLVYPRATISGRREKATVDYLA